MLSADLLIDARGAEIRHRSGLTAPDPFIYLASEGENPVVFFDAREYDVMSEKLAGLADGVTIERLEPYLDGVDAGEESVLVAGAIAIVQQRGIGRVRVSRFLPYAFGQQLEAAGLEVFLYNFGRERERKSVIEIEHLMAAQRVNESAFELVWRLLSESTIQGNTIVFGRQVVTSEWLKAEIRKHLLDRGFECPDGLIVASGEQTAQPHNEGRGPLQPHQCIIVDIFPRSMESGFFADMTRTFVKGEATREIAELFSTVEAVQRQVVDTMAVGQTCLAVHQGAVDHFAELGHVTSPDRGFMHGTGHSLGLDLHEDPCLNAHATRTVEAGMVFTVEPGLYYPGLGGVRIEDVVVFRPDGRKENITRFDKPHFIS